MGSDRRARRQKRVQDFGARHPRLTGVVAGSALAGVVAVDVYQFRYGTYLGRGWVIAALAGAASAAGLTAAAVISNRQHSPPAGRLLTAWLVLGVMSASAIRFPFPQGPYGIVQAFFNLAHAAMLGYEATIGTAIAVLMAYLVLRPRSAARRPEARTGQAKGPGGLPARLRFPGAESATWRAGRLIAANGTVMWLSRKGDAEVDLTSACQALPLLPTDTRRRKAYTTTLATASGLVEVDVSPKALAALASRD